METASVSELKSRLSEFLRLVRGGGSIMIMDRGKPVAVLGPVQSRGEAKDMEAGLARLRDAGLVRIGSGKLPEDFWDWPRPKDPDRLAVKGLLQDREEGR
jgi:prevent-host-death family protein